MGKYFVVTENEAGKQFRQLSTEIPTAALTQSSFSSQILFLLSSDKNNTPPEKCCSVSSKMANAIHYECNLSPDLSTCPKTISQHHSHVSE